VCSLTPDGAGRFELSKDTPVISFGEYADAFLITTRRTPDAVANDQVLALARREDVVLQPLGPWDALGLRGSCSRPFHLNATVHADMVIDNNRHVIDATGLPVTNLMFVGSWIGMAESAATAAHRFVRKRHAGTDEPAVIARVRLAEILALLDELRGLANATMARFTVLDGTEDVSSIAFVMQLQTLKVAGSHLTSEIALQSLALCGVAGFRNDSEFTLGRAVRDSLGSLVMVSNDAVLGQNGQLALVRKEV
jgi:acyl-CoA dehydrogenase